MTESGAFRRFTTIVGTVYPSLLPLSFTVLPWHEMHRGLSGPSFEPKPGHLTTLKTPGILPRVNLALEIQ